jgi:hypothetical protein
VPSGLPSQLLERRPDLRAAERRLAAATADIGVATADLYPKFNLTGALQLASRSLTTLVQSDSILGNGAGRLSLPAIGGAGRATVRLREGQAREALLAYQGDVLVALRDVEDALTRLDADRRRVDSLAQAGPSCAMPSIRRGALSPWSGERPMWRGAPVMAERARHSDAGAGRRRAGCGGALQGSGRRLGRGRKGWIMAEAARTPGWGAVAVAWRGWPLAGAAPA